MDMLKISTSFFPALGLQVRGELLPRKRMVDGLTSVQHCLDGIVSAVGGGWFSLVVSAPDTVLGVIIVFAMAFGGFAWAENGLVSCI